MREVDGANSRTEIMAGAVAIRLTFSIDFLSESDYGLFGIILYRKLRPVLLSIVLFL